MYVKREISEDVYGMVLQRLRDMAKADCLNPNVQWWNCTLVGSTSETRRHREPSVRLSPRVRLARWTMRSERIQGHVWGAYVALVRSSVTEHGMAYGPRGLGSRSRHSSRGRHVPPGSAGKPRAGRRAAGYRMFNGR